MAVLPSSEASADHHSRGWVRQGGRWSIHIGRQKAALSPSLPPQLPWMIAAKAPVAPRCRSHLGAVHRRTRKEAADRQPLHLRELVACVVARLQDRQQATTGWLPRQGIAQVVARWQRSIAARCHYRRRTLWRVKEAHRSWHLWDRRCLVDEVFRREALRGGLAGCAAADTIQCGAPLAGAARLNSRHQVPLPPPTAALLPLPLQRC